MKIVIELDDKVLRDAVTAQVGIALSEMTRETVTKMANEVISKTLERTHVETIVERYISGKVDSAIKDEIGRSLGVSTDNRNQNIKVIVANQVREMLKKAMLP